jgi:hypothetical protein
MAIGRKPMCRKHPRQYAHNCVSCEKEFKTKMQQTQLETEPKEDNDAADDSAVATEDK